MKFDQQVVSRYPQKPGVYLMLDQKGTVLYVGKAKNIQKRIKSYFVKTGDDRPQIPYLLARLHSIETIVVDSEKEALLLENTLIKKHQPKYNVLLKDDKGYISLKVTTKHAWPMIQLVRYKGAPPKDGTYFGPYTSAYQARKLFDLVGKLFPLRECSDSEFRRRTRPCMLYQIKRCSAPCVGYVSKDVYHNYLKEAISFIKGNNSEVIETLKVEMQEAVDALEFERAQAILEKVRLVESLDLEQKVDKIPAKDADIWALFRQGSEGVICKLLFRFGKLVGSDHFDFSGSIQQTDELLSSFLLQHYMNESKKPHEILLYDSLEDQKALAEIIGSKLIFPKIGEKKKFVEMAKTNAEAIYRQRNDEKVLSEKRLLQLQEEFRLKKYPKKIICFDNSHISGAEPVSVEVSFVDGKKETKGYRTYKIKKESSHDDYAMMYEVLSRSLERKKALDMLPDLIIIDGGKGQLNVCLKVLKEKEIISCDVLAISKDEARHDKGITKEKIFLPERKDPIFLPKHSSLLFFLQNIRDEAHRFAIEFQKKRRKKTTIKSQLDAISGIGPQKKKALLKAHKSVKAIAELSVDELMQTDGISKKDAEIIHRFFSD